jgi:hypothetical protein
MANTTNFNWETPDDTDLVKDGAAAIRTLGNGIDTSFLDLKGGTSGQVLSKNSNTDLDYTWVTPNVGDITEVQAGTGISVASGTGPIPVVTNTVATAFDAAGDLVYGTGADTFTKLSLGTAGKVLTVNSGATAPEWATPAGGGGWTQIGSTTNLSGSSTSITSIPGTYNQLVIFVEDYYASGDVNPFIYLNADTGSNYKGFMIRASNGGFGSTYISSPYIEYFGLRSAQDDNFTVITINNYAGGTKKLIECRSAVRENATYEGMPSQTNIVWNNSAAVTSIAIATDTGTWSAGTIKVYGVK